MVDFKKMLEEHKAKGKFLGYCTNIKCDNGKVYEVNILPAYKDLSEKEQKTECPKCGHYELVDELIPF